MRVDDALKINPIVLLAAAVAIAAALTWVVPAGEYMRQADAVTGRTLVVPGTYHRVDASPVSPAGNVRRDSPRVCGCG